MTEHPLADLNLHQVNQLANYLVQGEFRKVGFNIRTPDKTQQELGFLAEKKGIEPIRVLLRSSRKLDYIFVPKSHFIPDSKLFLGVVLLSAEKPDLYLISSEIWNTPDSVFVSRDYTDRKSPPEYGINLSETNLAVLEPYRFEPSLNRLLSTSVMMEA